MVASDFSALSNPAFRSNGFNILSLWPWIHLGNCFITQSPEETISKNDLMAVKWPTGRFEHVTLIRAVFRLHVLRLGQLDLSVVKGYRIGDYDP